MPVRSPLRGLQGATRAGLWDGVNSPRDAARYVEHEDEVEGSGDGLHVTHRALDSVFGDCEILCGESSDCAAAVVGDASLHARETRAGAGANVEWVCGRRGEGRFRAVRGKRADVVGDEARRDLANRADQFRVAAADDGARRVGQRALAQVRRDFRLVLDAEEDDAARRLKFEPDALGLVRLLVAEAPRYLHGAAQLRLGLRKLDLAEEARAAERPTKTVAQSVERNVGAYRSGVGLGLPLGDVAEQVNRARLGLDEDARARGHTHRQVNPLALDLRVAQNNLATVGRSCVGALDFNRDRAAALRNAHVLLADGKPRGGGRAYRDLLRVVGGF